MSNPKESVFVAIVNTTVGKAAVYEVMKSGVTHHFDAVDLTWIDDGGVLAHYLYGEIDMLLRVGFNERKRLKEDPRKVHFHIKETRELAVKWATDELKKSKGVKITLRPPASE